MMILISTVHPGYRKVSFCPDCRGPMIIVDFSVLPFCSGCGRRA